MKRPYLAVLWQLDPHSSVCAWTISNTRAFRTMERARRQCLRWMHSKRLYLSRYQTPRMAPFAEVLDRRRRGLLLESHDVEIKIVPSVGELGYW